MAGWSQVAAWSWWSGLPVPDAGTYQQLRTHLVDLKLADAADALPKVLDQAQAEGWTLTTALERLLAIEVTATDARRLAGRFRFANLPTGATLDDFDHDHASGIDQSLLAEIHRILDTHHAVGKTVVDLSDNPHLPQEA